MGCGDFHKLRPWVLHLCLCFILLGHSLAYGISRGDEEQKAKAALATKLFRLSQSLDMKEASYPESAGGGGKDYNANDGNAFTSNTTYHSYVWSYCLRWIGGRLCERWLDPYVSIHGLNSDKSPLEAEVLSAWQRLKKDEVATRQGGNADYAIWQVRARNGATILDTDNKLDPRALAEWKLRPDVKQNVENIGTQTAERQITYMDESAQGTLPNMEGLRIMASRWTKMFRNRLLANLGEQRAIQPGIEFALGEEIPDAPGYVRAISNSPDEQLGEERILSQPTLDPETKALTLQERIALYQQALEMSAYAVNPRVQGKGITEGGVDTEPVDMWRTRVNLALVDYAGISPNDIPKPGDAAITQEEYATPIADYAPGGLTYRTVMATNAQQIASYNRALDEAAISYQEIAARSRNIADRSAEVAKWKIQVGSVNLVRLNGLTPEMRNELKETSYPVNGAGSRGELSPEQSPAELTFRSLR